MQKLGAYFLLGYSVHWVVICLCVDRQQQQSWGRVDTDNARTTQFTQTFTRWTSLLRSAFNRRGHFSALLQRRQWSAV